MELLSNHYAVLVEVKLPGGLSPDEDMKLTVSEVYHKRMLPLPK